MAALTIFCRIQASPCPIWSSAVKRFGSDCAFTRFSYRSALRSYFVEGRTVATLMDYWIINISTGELVVSAEAHVLARAYRAAWRAQNLNEPEGAHQFEPLDLMICYGGWAASRTAISEDGVRSNSRYPKPRSNSCDERDD